MSTLLIKNHTNLALIYVFILVFVCIKSVLEGVRNKDILKI